MELKELKKNYSILAKKYKLPSFENLNENFEIDKIDRETETPLRLIRKVMMEKLVNSMGFLDLLLNPVNAPRMYVSYSRSLSIEDRKVIDEIYSILGDVSLSSLELEIDSSEKKEAEIIKRICSAWESVKPKFRKIMTNMKKPNKVIAKKDKTYFG